MYTFSFNSSFFEKKKNFHWGIKQSNSGNLASQAVETRPLLSKIMSPDSYIKCLIAFANSVLEITGLTSLFTYVPGCFSKTKEK
jgi:hypothetical protein